MKIKILEIINNEIKGKKILHRDDVSSSWRAVLDVWDQINAGFSTFYSEDNLVAGHYVITGSTRFTLTNHLIIVIMFGDDGHPTPLNGFKERISARTLWKFSDFNPEVIAELEHLDPSTIKPAESSTNPMWPEPVTVCGQWQPRDARGRPLGLEIREEVRQRDEFLRNQVIRERMRQRGEFLRAQEQLANTEISIT